MQKVINYWGGDNYKGLNCAFREKSTGRMIEVQFNTSASQYAKDTYSHSLYEQIRAIGISAGEKYRLNEIMIKSWGAVDSPTGWEQILNI